eukprot:6186714-Pleurochrysis_carterae.AAC.2
MLDSRSSENFQCLAMFSHSSGLVPSVLLTFISSCLYARRFERVSLQRRACIRTETLSARTFALAPSR